MSSNYKNFVQNFWKNPAPYLIQIAGLLVVFFNLWIASKLAPLTEDINTIQTEVKAIEGRQDVIKEDFEIYVKETARELNIIDSKLDVMHDDILIIKETLNRFINNK
jgi:hypothetical protein